MNARARFSAVILDNVFSEYEIEREILEQALCSVIVADPKTEEETIPMVRDADAVMVNLHPLSEKSIKAMKNCRIISRYGVGYDNVDIKFASQQGIWVANVPDYCTPEASDHAIALLLSCVRNIPGKDRMLRAGGWKMEHALPSLRIAGKTLGIIGYGKVGRAVHRKLSGWDLGRILIYDPYVNADSVKDKNARITSLQTLCAESDFITIHAPLSEETFHLIGRPELSLMKKSAILVNTARGKIIDEPALMDALCHGRIRNAGLDVYATEPLPADSPLRSMDSVVLSDHTAYHSGESEIELKTLSALNVVETLLNGKPMYPVNSPHSTSVPAGKSACGRIPAAV